MSENPDEILRKLCKESDEIQELLTNAEVLRKVIRMKKLEQWRD